MPKTSKVKLGGREYILSEKVMGVSRAWREKLRESDVMKVFSSLDEALASLVNAVNGLGSNAGEGQVTLTAGLNIATVAPVIVRGLVNSIDEVIDLLFDYSPELKADEEWLLDNAYDEEAINAFIEVLKLNFPISALWGLVRGPKVLATSTNLPSLNGVGNGPQKNSARSKSR